MREVCLVCLRDWRGIQKVYEEACGKYPKLRNATLAMFVKRLWDIHLQEKNGKTSRG